jgi:hypothetical protein
MALNKIYLLIILFNLTTNSASSQSDTTWQKIQTNSNQNLFIDLAGLEHYTGDDIYVWVMEEFDEPFEFEASEEKISLSKTYYLINKSRKMYSILEIIYFNEEGAVSEYFNYWRETDVESYKYNYPILTGSAEEVILNNCISFIEKKNSEIK